jgi:DNA-binding transcriptional MerR regulator
MFKIGEFSRIARISTRQLRHYDEIGLFQPERTEPGTGYRYYSAAQLPQLNRILALKDLGFTLEQIARLMQQKLSAEELGAMLTMRKAQIEQALQAELERVRSIEERIWQVETEGVLSDDDVVLKSVPEQKFLSIRQIIPTVRDGFAMIDEIHRLLPQRAGTSILGNFGVLFHSPEFTMEHIDVEMGFLMAGAHFERFALSDGRELTLRTVPAVETMATLARVGIHNDSVGHYGALGTWIEARDYQLAGAGWEIFLQPFVPGKEGEAVVEIQIPVQKIERQIS